MKKSVIPMIVIPILNFYLFELYLYEPWENMKPSIQLLNIALFELLMVIFLFIFGSVKWSLILQSAFFMVVGLANYYVMSFRSAPIMPWDLYSIGTALSVADNFEYKLEGRVILVIIGFFILIAVSLFTKFDIKKMPLKWRGGCLLIFICLLYGYVHMLHLDSTIVKFGIYDKLFTPAVMSKRDGTAAAFIMELKYISVDKPSGYDSEKAQDILADYGDDITQPERRPNIIVVMNEAFSDLSVLGQFETNEDYMPFIRSLMNKDTQNVVSGHLHVSVLGGNTANTEFEFLTGNTMAFLPQGSIPYQQYVKSETVSLASHLKSLGYDTCTVHPYNSTGWDRNKVYPLLGFDNSYFISSFVNPSRIRKYVSDSSCYDKIIELYEKKDKDTPLFLFSVTMQNHSSYTEDFDNFVPEISVKGSNSKALNNYLSLIKISDTAVSELVNYFASEDEETVIIFFGDHQPTNSVVSDIWRLNGKNGSRLSDDDEAKRYTVPFFVWSNFDIDEEYDVEISANYLGAKVLDICGLPLYDYADYLLHLSEEYPIVTGVRTIDADGSVTDIKNAEGALNDYAVLQYNRMFD